MTIAVGVILTLLGLIIAMKGRRARRLDDHPWCRKCAFDLHGRWPDVSVCPECGADLAKRRAVRHGHRAARRGRVVAGLVTVVIGLVLAGPSAWSRARRTDLTAYKPDWWLAMETSSTSTWRVQHALRELEQRLIDDRLSAGRISDLVDRGLAAQASPRPWIDGWGNFIETAQIDGFVDPARWERYLRQAPQLILTARSKIREGDPLPIRLDQPTSRVGFFSFAEVSFRVTGLDLEGTVRSVDGPLFETELDVEPLETSKISTLQPTALPLGRHAVEALVEIEVTSPAGPSAKWVATHPLEITVLPRDAVIVTPINDPAIAPAMRECVTFSRLFTSRGTGDPEQQLTAVIVIDAPPAATAARVVAIGRTGRWDLGSIYVEAGARSLERVSSTLEEPIDDETLTLVLEPDLEGAAQTVALEEAWARPIIFEAQPLLHYLNGRLQLREETLRDWGRSCVELRRLLLQAEGSGDQLVLHFRCRCAPAALRAHVTLRGRDEQFDMGYVDIVRDGPGASGTTLVKLSRPVTGVSEDVFEIMLRAEADDKSAGPAWIGEVSLGSLELKRVLGPPNAGLGVGGSGEGS